MVIRKGKLAVLGVPVVLALCLAGCGDEKYPGYKAARPTPNFDPAKPPPGGVPGMNPKMIPAKQGGAR